MIDPVHQLRSCGLHVTAQRLAVLRAVSACPHGTAEQVAEAVRADIGTISQQAVYDALGVLSAKGLLRRVQPAGYPALYDPRVGDQHQHAICTSCGAVADVDCDVDLCTALRAATHCDYQIDKAEILYWGTCGRCTGSKDQSPAHSHPS